MKLNPGLCSELDPLFSRISNLSVPKLIGSGIEREGEKALLSLTTASRGSQVSKRIHEFDTDIIISIFPAHHVNTSLKRCSVSFNDMEHGNGTVDN